MQNIKKIKDNLSIRFGEVSPHVRKVRNAVFVGFTLLSILLSDFF